MKRYAELIGNYKSQRIKNLQDNKLVIDADYRGNVIVALHNDTAEIQEINPRDRIAQLIIMPYTIVDSIAVVGDLDDTARSTNGFGSTGI